jgi:hypothetical protein
VVQVVAEHSVLCTATQPQTYLQECDSKTVVMVGFSLLHVLDSRVAGATY